MRNFFEEHWDSIMIVVVLIGCTFAVISEMEALRQTIIRATPDSIDTYGIESALENIQSELSDINSTLNNVDYILRNN